MYEYTDRVIAYLNKRFIRIFQRAKSLATQDSKRRLSIDELNVLSASKSIYAELESITIQAFLRLANVYYLEIVGQYGTPLGESWLYEILQDYDPVTKYVFLHEVERKRARFAESLIAGSNKAEEISTALRYWSAMIRQYAVLITDEAIQKAYEDTGVVKVVWITKKDERRCSVCRERDGKVYRLADVPAKPHIGCRCHLVPKED